MYVTEKKNIMTNNETKLCLDKKIISSACTN